MKQQKINLIVALVVIILVTISCSKNEDDLTQTCTCTTVYVGNSMIHNNIVRESIVSSKEECEAKNGSDPVDGWTRTCRL